MSLSEKQFLLLILKAFADEIGIPFMETSAKNATNVEQAFMAMSADIKNRFAFSVLVPSVHVFLFFFGMSFTWVNTLHSESGAENIIIPE